MLWYLILAAGLVGITVLIHYEALQLAALTILPRLHLHPARLLVIIGVLICMLAHVVEIWVVALVLYGLTGLGLDLGYVDPARHRFLDFLNNSAESYTSLGYGDAEQLTEAHRLLSGAEALTGLVMIAWTASFTFVLMERYWRQSQGPR